MKTSRLPPQTLIQTAIADAERALKAEEGDRVLDQADDANLPPGLRQVVDEFRASGHAEVRAQEVIGALRGTLEAGLSQSLTKGEIVPSELSAELQTLLAFSRAGVHVRASAQAPSAAPADLASATRSARQALAAADLSVSSQVRVLKELTRAAELAKSEAPDRATLLEGIAKDRTNLVRSVVERAVDNGRAAFAARPHDPASKRQLGAALEAAIEVHVALNPKSARLKALRAELIKLGGPAKKHVQPFFARFLEHQLRGPAPGPQAQAEGPGFMVTMKHPSDNEDGGAPAPDEGGVVTTMKAPSDHEDDGAPDLGDEGGIVTTMKYPSDNEDGGAPGLGDDGGVLTTMKAPSDHEDDGAPDLGDDGGMLVTMKYPSDNEDGGAPDVGDDGGMLVTMKYPSDNEDGGAPGLGDDGLGPVPTDDPSGNEGSGNA